MQEKYQDTIKTFLFRNKDKGWHPSGLQMGTRIDFDSGMSVRVAPAFRDAYMNGFLDDIYLRPSCYDCEFKDLSKYYTDITIADFWGVTKVDNMLHDGKGTSLVLLHNRHGESLFDVVKENFFYKEVDINKALKKNKSMLHSAAKNPIRARFFYDYQNDSFEKVRRKYMNAFKWAFHKGIKTFWKYIRQLIIGVGTPILSIFDQKWSTEKWDAFFQFVKFAFVGVSNTVVSYVINITTLFLLRGFGMKFDYVIANLTAFTLSVLWSYHWNSTYVFHPNQYSKGERVRTLLKTYASYACSGIFLNNILATVWIQGFGVSKYISPVLNLPFSMTVNFFMQKLWAYKDRKVENVD